MRQLIAAPAEIIGAAGIIYFALPETGNPGFLVVLAVFIFSFSAALASNAPGGLGVFELVFLKSHARRAAGRRARGAAAVPPALSADPARRCAIFVVLGFERRRLAEAIEHHHHLAEEKVEAEREPEPKPEPKPKG